MPKTEQLQQNESLAHTIRNRRSIRSFKPETVPSEVILDMLETAVYAPNHRLTEPWRFIYAASEAGKESLRTATSHFSKNKR
nr:nitroreductase family protein [Bacillus velezensis]